jgi:addiction module HigA family antidote
MAKKSANSVGVGAHIRQHVIPPGLSVKAAAIKLGVGRPALSNLLNGNAALSPDMAARLEKAFGANQNELLALQAEADRDLRQRENKAVTARAYVPHFLSIKARQIEAWADGLDARQHLAVLLRKLIHSTGQQLRHVDFPGFDNAERKGADGFIESDAVTAWIPEDTSYWEFGVSRDAETKANDDYRARTKAVPASDRSRSTFVFVTPRNWPGKTEWARTKRASGGWKTVRALDASDLEQWLEESVSAQMWLAERLALPVTGFETLDSCWHRWSTASEPPLTPEIFAPSIAAYCSSFKAWLEKPSDRPFIVAADSRGEALAFLSCLFRDEEIPTQARDIAVVFDSSQTLRTLGAASAPFIPIAFTEETERELAPLYRRLHCIVIRPRNAVDSDPDIALDLLGHEAFDRALTAMGIGRDEADRLEAESGRSPTILRRRLSKIDAIRTPEWAGDATIARSLIPMTLVGAWHAKSKADTEILAILVDGSYQEVEETVARLLRFDDCPVWSIGEYRGVASKIDSLFAVRNAVTERDLHEFITLAEYVLAETDPALDLPEDKRWAAGAYGKVRDHSSALRRGVCETLVLLSVHGNNLFGDRLGVNVEAAVSRLITRLLSPLTRDKLLSHDNDLPRYAEAAPDAFFKIFEEDLRTPEPIALGLLKPSSGGIFGGCPRTGLLWALECLAWKPENLARVSAILAQLSRIKIEDNYANTPIGTLSSIFRAWIPQTAASLDERSKVLEMLTKRFPEIGWKICLQQIDPRSSSGDYNSRPRWRSDASGAGQPVSDQERYLFARKALDLALAWPHHSADTLGDLVECLEGMPEADIATVWDKIDTWSAAESDEAPRAKLRERIRRFAFTRRGSRRELKPAARNRAQAAYEKLAPHDPAIRHAWLFANQWVEESTEELEDETLDYTQREEKIHRQRTKAMKEIWNDRGFEGVAALLRGSNAPHTVGQYAALSGPVSAAPEFLRQCLSLTGDAERSADACMYGFLVSLDAAVRSSLLAAVASGADADRVVRLFRCAPFAQETWRDLNQYPDTIRDRYWREVVPQWYRHTDTELNEIVDSFLQVDRPRAAFLAVHRNWKEIETSRLKRLLRAIANSPEPAGHYKLDAHDVAEAVHSLDGRSGVSPDEMVQLEFMFLDALDRSNHGIPNLERQLAESPNFFVQAVAIVFNRDDNAEDPPELRIDDPDKAAAAAPAVYRLLNRARRIPGTDADGNVRLTELSAWLKQARELCSQAGRLDFGDYRIGELLSKARAGDDGIWPCPPVCEAMEAIASQRIAEGFSTGVRNARGDWRGEGGAQERDLAAKYRGWAQERAADYPYVGSILHDIANSYEREAEREDSRSKLRKRLRA